MQITQGLKIMVGVRPQPTQQPVTASQKSDVQFLMEFFDEQDYPLDVTAATTLVLKAIEADGSTRLTKSLLGGIALVSGYPARVLVTLIAADLALLPTGDVDLDVEMDLAGRHYAFNLYRGLSIEPAVA